MISNNCNIIVSGSSITNDSAWPTWATFVKRRYKFDKVIDVSSMGAGNEVIITRAINEAKKINKNVLIVIQLTSVDKWDWYVENNELVELISHEKHTLIKMSPEDRHGFWSTGSHFPKWKEYFKHNYFSLEYFTFRTLQLIQWFQMVCQQQKWEYYIIFDSPILSVTENQLNTGILQKTECIQLSLLNNKLCQTISELVNIEEIYLPGLIGYACLNDLPWYHQKFKSHPGSLTHYRYVKDIIFPALDLKKISAVDNFDELEEEALKFQKIINQT
jgi:hypothetical protein